MQSEKNNLGCLKLRMLSIPPVFLQVLTNGLFQITFIQEKTEKLEAIYAVSCGPELKLVVKIDHENSQRHQTMNNKLLQDGVFMRKWVQKCL